MTSHEKISVSSCVTHHIKVDGMPLYESRFDEVLSFHQTNSSVQLASVTQGGKSWHILEDGSPAYSAHFDRTFGFYCGYASVVLGDEWFHITPSGAPAYDERYIFAGNFQNDVCVVCDHDGAYFHINQEGRALYGDKWKYCGDFREGIAVVQSASGLSTHITTSGKFLHQCWFNDLDVYHKGCARARDLLGWFHIDKTGHERYPQRYANVEPFYNGCARVESHSGALLIIDERGQNLRSLREPATDDFSALSADMVGYWKTFAIATAVELNLFEHLPDSAPRLAQNTKTAVDRLIRLLNGLAELRLVQCQDGIWSATNKGHFLCTKHPQTLATAALEYREKLLHPWASLPDLIRGSYHAQKIFTSVAKNPDRLPGHHTMLQSYARHDYEGVISSLPIESGDVVFDAGGGTGELTRLLQTTFPKAKLVLGDLPEVVEAATVKNKVGFDLFQPWPLTADKIILARVLHDWSDKQSIDILKHAKTALAPSGKILAVEMLLPEGGFDGALCDLHLLSVTGGQERTESQLTSLAEQAGLFLECRIPTQGLVSILVFSSGENLA
ncbi:MAG: methyltransferase [Gammaproteobacteria bacterium]|nr:methyltransferase [Gammaproteobacteria bacterium]